MSHSELKKNPTNNISYLLNRAASETLKYSGQYHVCVDVPHLFNYKHK